jgi:hypothetical protein
MSIRPLPKCHNRYLKASVESAACTTEKPCRYVPNPHAPPAGQLVLTCEWADKSQTLCTNPMCLEKAEGEPS